MIGETASTSPTATGNFALAPGAEVQKPTISTVTVALEIVGRVAKGMTRRDSMEQLAHGLAKYFPASSVRCALGNQEQLGQFFDNRLGWIGVESSLFTDTNELWPNLPLHKRDAQPVGRDLFLIMPDDTTNQSLVAWIQSDLLVEAKHDWIGEMLPALSTVFWRRPAIDFSRYWRQIGLGNAAWLAIALALVCLVTLFPIRYRVACRAVVQPVQQRLIAAPFEATLLKAHFSPGDSVKQGQVLVSFDGRPLRLELESVKAEIQQYSKQQDVALATGKIAEAQQAGLKHRQLSRQRDLLQHRLTQLQVLSPADGVVVSGDLQEYVGSPLTTGQVIAEVAPLDKMVIEVEIPDYEIAFVPEGAEAKIKLNGVGGPSIRTALAEVYPSAEVREDTNVFIGKVETANKDSRLRPGMRGEATTYGPRRPLIWPWIRGGYERVLWWMGY